MRTLIRKLKNILFISSILLFFAFNFQGNPPQGWYLQTLPVNKTINDIYFLDSLNGWTVTTGSSGAGDSAYIFKTTNGGDNWDVSFKDYATFTKVQFINKDTGYVGGGTLQGDRYLYKTTNSGTNWIRLLGTFGVGNALTGMQFINADTGWISDANSIDGGILKTTNGGINWFYQLGQSSQIVALDFPSRDTGYAINFFNLYKTTNSGTNWNLQQNFPQGISSINFLNSQTGWISRNGSSNTNKTTNGGINWFTQYGVPQEGKIALSNLTNLSILNKDTLWGINGMYSGTTNFFGILFLSTNGGDTWGYQLPDTTLNIGIYHQIFFTDKNNGWAYFTNRGVHTKIGGNDTTYFVTSVNSPETELPKDFVLYQNYPNPFNPSTTINYELKITNYVTLKVFDLNGKEIQTLVNKKQTAGNYSVQFNGTNLSSGIYFYTLQTDNFKDTKKMLMIK